MNFKIEQIESHYPNNCFTNDDLAVSNPNWDMKKVQEKTGVFKRFFADESETALDLSIHAVQKLFDNYQIDKNSIDGIIYCTQSPDYIMPPNAFLIHKHFGFESNVLAFDINMACSGYIYCLSIANGFFSSNVANRILIINADTYSKYINKKDRSARVLFGDGAAATIVSNDPQSSILDISLASSGKDYKSFYIPAGAHRLPVSYETSKEFEDASGNIKSLNDIEMNGFNVWKFISTAVPNQINDLLKKNGLRIEEIDLFVFHQASKMTLDSLANKLKIKEEQLFLNLQNVGNTVSASIPLALKDAIDQNRLKRGNTILLSGFGVGLSYGSILLKY